MTLINVAQRNTGVSEPRGEVTRRIDGVPDRQPRVAEPRQMVGISLDQRTQCARIHALRVPWPMLLIEHVLPPLDAEGHREGTLVMKGL